MKKYSLKDMKQLAQSRGGNCISTSYLGMNTHLRWRCSKGHEWDAIPSSVRTGHWCPYCYGNRPFSIDDLRQLAMSRGGELLSTEYANRRSLLHWRCAEGHEWKTVAFNVMTGSWCPVCGGSQKLSIVDAVIAAEAKEGKCLSQEYKNARTTLLWECSAKWKATFGKIRGGQWCPVCRKNENAAKLRLTLQEVQERASEKGGRCLATKYGGTAGTPLQFECSKGHQWWAAPNTIRKSWCPSCAGKIVTLDDVQKIARERRGECLSTIYVNDNTKLVWRCRYNHTWHAIPGSIKRGGWCPECSAGLGERLCRVFFESLFGDSFPQAYPEWLKLGHRIKLQLDGYNKKLALAFEHHGQYHFRVDGHYSRNGEQLQKRQELDRRKEELCLKYGITLIVVPEIPSMLSLDHAQSFIINMCKEKGVSVPHQNATPNFASAYSPDWWDYYDLLAQSRGGCLVTPQYLGSGKKHRWRCKNGHDWDTVPNSIQQGKLVPILCWNSCNR